MIRDADAADRLACGEKAFASKPTRSAGKTLSRQNSDPTTSVVSLGCARLDSVLCLQQIEASPPRHFIVGITNSEAPPTAVGQREVTVLRRV
jgi:hypothetical protein